jgi:tripartite-type tricarboxylate transporter receptor subunit TctC
MVRWVLAGLALTTVLWSSGVRSQDNFYKGKQIRIVVSASTTYADYARMLARFMPRYISGEPSFLVQVMSGASGLVAANYIYSIAPRDGTVIAGTHGHIPTEALINPKAAQYDVNRISWIGSATKDTYVGYVWKTAPVQSLDELKTKELLVGGQAIGSMSIDMPLLGRELLDLKFKIVTGYKGTEETKLAVARGEVGGHIGTLWSTVKKSEWLRDGQIKVITQFGFTRHPDLPDVPLFLDLAKTPEDRGVLELMLARQETAKPYFGPPGIPADRLGMLRDAFDATVKDPEYLAEMDRLGLPTDGPMGWQEMTLLIARLQKTSPETLNRLHEIFDRAREGK